MKLRLTSLFFLGFLVAGCGGDAGETADAAAEAEEFEAPAEMDTSADEAALAGLRSSFVEHYNMHHASMVADFYSDSALALLADGSVNEGRDAIEASLETAMAGSPTLGLSNIDEMVFGDWAVSLGEYNVETTPEGAGTITLTGNYMTASNRLDGDWKLAFVVTNYNGEVPEGLPMSADVGTDPPEEEGTMGDLVAAYEEHFNAGHGSMVADFYTEDAMAGLSNLPLARGRAAIAALLEERLAVGNPQLDIHDVGTLPLGEGWALDGGWYELTADDGVSQTGAYILLCRQADDGSWQIHWAVSNGRPMTM